LDLRGSKDQENGEVCKMRNFINCNPRQILLGGSNWQGMQQARGKMEFIKCFVIKSEEKTPLGRPKCRWEDNIKLILRELGRGAVHWVMWSRTRKLWWNVFNTLMIIQVSQETWNF
jgi:hypothetical protein